MIARTAPGAMVVSLLGLPPCRLIDSFRHFAVSEFLFKANSRMSSLEKMR